MGGNSSKSTGDSRIASPTQESLQQGQLDGFKQPLHNGPIYCLSLVGEDYILCGGAAKEITLFRWKDQDLSGEFQNLSFQGPVKDVTKICYNNTSSFIFAGSRDRSIYAWKLPPSNEPGIATPSSYASPAVTMQGHSLGVSALDTSEAHPQLLCSGSRDNSVCLWDLDVKKPVSSMYAPRNIVTDIKWISGESAVLQSSEDKTLRVWDLTTCSTVQHFRARNYLQTCCAVSSDQLCFLAGSSGSDKAGGQLTLWDRRNEKKPLMEFEGHVDGVCGCMFLSHQSSKVICSVGGDSSIRIWEQDSGTLLCETHQSDCVPLTDVVSPQEGVLVCSSFNGNILFCTLSGAVDKSLHLTFS